MAHLVCVGVLWVRPASGAEAVSPPSAATKVNVAGVFTDYRTQKPGTIHRITAADLPKPFATPTVDNGPRVVPRPSNAWPQAPVGFNVQLYADHLIAPRLIRTAPNGDTFVVESKAGNIRVLRGIDSGGRVQESTLFASGLNRPFGIAFYPVLGQPHWLYVANTNEVVRFAYSSGDLRARAATETVVATSRTTATVEPPM